ncbi:MAG: hypothetical protein JO356_21270 [Acidobacteria bacterium]|nr:hypothetical protein [Acidobacteriota bacterium]
MPNLARIVQDLRKEHDRLDAAIAALELMGRNITLLGSLRPDGLRKGRRRRPGSKNRRRIDQCQSLPCASPRFLRYLVVEANELYVTSLQAHALAED